MLPPDLMEWLDAKRSLEYDSARAEVGQVSLKSVDQLEESDVWISSAGSDFESDDPNRGIEGYYTVKAVSLVSKCESYEPDHILSYVPSAGVFTAWDCDHWDLWAFPSASWIQICEDPLKYLNAQWDPNSTAKSWFVPWPRYQFRKGMPF